MRRHPGSEATQAGHRRAAHRPRRLPRKLLLAVPDRYRGLVAVSGGAGLRWGEAAGLCADAVDLNACWLRLSARWSRSPVTPSSRATQSRPRADGPSLCPAGWSRSSAPVSSGTGTAKPTCSSPNGAGGAHRRTLFRTRQWRPSLVRAGLLGSVTHNATMGRNLDRQGRQATSVPNARPKMPPSLRSHAGNPAACAITICGTPTRPGWWTMGAAKHGPTGHGPRTGVHHSRPSHPANRRCGPHPASAG